LHDGDLLELAQCFLVDGMALLKEHYFIKEHAYGDVDDDYYYGRTNNHSFLDKVVCHPLSTVLVFVWCSVF
jgi:hypothetical protein